MAPRKSDRSFTTVCLADTPKGEHPADAHKRLLSELAHRLDHHSAFAKGQFVHWKPGLKNRKFPDYGEPCIVMAVLSAPIFDPSEDHASSCYFQEPLNLVIGLVREDDLLEFRVDGRRFEPIQA